MSTVANFQISKNTSLSEHRNPVTHVAKMVVAMVTGYLVAWLPYAVFSMYNVANADSPVRAATSDISRFLKLTRFSVQLTKHCYCCKLCFRN